MKKILLVFFLGIALFLAMTGDSMGQTGQVKPIGTKPLFAPNTPTFHFLQSDTTVGIDMGKYGYLELAGTIEFQQKIDYLTLVFNEFKQTYASETQYGIIKIATLLEVLAGVDDTKAVTPAKLRDYVTTNVVTYNDPTQNINLGDFNIKGDTALFTTVLVNGVPVIPGNYELIANKSTSVVTDGASDTKYASSKSVKTYADGKVADQIRDGYVTTAPSENAVFDALTAVNTAIALKAPINNPTFTGMVTTPALKITDFTNQDYVLKTNADGSIYSAPLAASQIYKGTWDATGNTPTLTNGTGTTGWYYRVTVAGTFGGVAYNVGDDISYNGTVWERIPAATIIGNPLTAIDDENITVNFTGSASTALLNATEITVAWEGTLVDNRIASSGNWNDVYERTTGTNTGDTEIYEIEVATTGVATYALPFTLKSNAVVWFQGSTLRNSQWSGAGTTSITLHTGTYVNDIIKIQN